MASLRQPKYRVVLKKRNKDLKYTLTNAAVEITLTDAEDGFAYQAEVKFANVKIDGKYLSSQTEIRDTLYIYVNTTKAETSDKDVLLFYGPVWQKNVLSEKEKTFTLTAYDSLIYLQKSEGCRFFKKGKKTKTIMKAICKSWGLKLHYSYSSVKHGKKKLRGDYSSFITNDLLEKVRRKTGKRGILRNDKGAIQVVPEGHNKSYYTIKNGENIISNEYVSTMEDVVTKVVIIGTKKKGKKTKTVKKTVKGNTKEWGTIQKIQDKGESKWKTAKKEAKQTIKDYGHPQTRRKITAYDIPFVRKGDQIKVNDDMQIVKTITHNFHERTMEMEVEKKK